MRFRDASHMNVAAFYAKHPRTGQVYRWAGYAGIVLAVALSHQIQVEVVLLGLLMAAWFMAWQRGVGALWRSTLVAALVCCASILSAHQLKPPAAPASGGNWAAVSP